MFQPIRQMRNEGIRLRRSHAFFFFRSSTSARCSFASLERAG